MCLGAAEFERKTKRTRKREFLDEISLAVPWAELVALIAPHAPQSGAKGVRPPFDVSDMLRTLLFWSSIYLDRKPRDDSASPHCT